MADETDEAPANAELAARAAAVELREVDPSTREAELAVGQYFAELDARFAGGFDVAAARAEDASSRDAAPGSFTVALHDDEPVACGAVRDLEPGTGEIKRMWVHPSWRGVGLGARLLRHLEGVAAQSGHNVVRLDTNATLVEAVALYERVGYRRINRYNANPYAQAWFEKELTAPPE